MTVIDDHIAHHHHVQEMYEILLADLQGVQVHRQTDPRYDSNFWLCTIMLDETLKVKGQENSYSEKITTAVGGAAGVVHVSGGEHTDCEPNSNVEAMRVFLDKAGIEARPLWKPMHLQPVYKDSPAYSNGVSEGIFKRGLCLPSGPCVSDEDVIYIVEKIKESIIG